ncbi:hypothetical protein AVEN_202030-1, partial [Araneus ventricosus]
NRELSAKLSAGILKLQEEGVLHTLKNKWWKQKDGGKCTIKQSNTVRELTLGNVGGVFVVLIFDLGVSVVVAFIEFRWKTFQWENPNKNQDQDNPEKSEEDVLTGLLSYANADSALELVLSLFRTANCLYSDRRDV